jgi:NADH-quinone oxidoreductase subunit J
MVETVVFVISAIVILTGALGVIIRKHPVHAALSMVQTLFGVAVLFVAMEANFLAAVQVIVYAGAIVVLFLFVIMLVGLDKVDKIDSDPLAKSKPLAVLAGVAIFALMSVTFLNKDNNDPPVTGQQSITAALVSANSIVDDENRTEADRVAEQEASAALAAAKDRLAQLKSSGATDAELATAQSEVQAANDVIINARKAKQAAELEASDGNVKLLARNLFNEYNFAFQATGVLLVIAVIGAVILARRPLASDHLPAVETTS